ALDLKGGTRGSANEWITIPDLQSKQLSMSSLILGERTAAEDLTSSTPIDTGALGQVSVNLDHRFARTSYLRFVAYIYNAIPSGAAPQSGAGPGPGMLTSGSTKPAALDLATQVQIFRDNEPVITTPLRKLTPNGADLRRIPYSAEVKLDQLRPGSYVL